MRNRLQSHQLNLVARSLTLLALVLVVSSFVGVTEPDAIRALRDDEIIVLEGATLIDGTGAAPRQDVAIVVENHRIRRIGRSGQVEYPSGARVVQLGGRFIIPGLIDVHTHVQTPVHAEVMAMLLAYGITTVRIPGGTNVGVQVRDMVERGEMLGPRVFTGGTLIDGEGGDGLAVRSGEEMREEVRRQHADGVDLIKLYAGLEPALVRVAIEEAHSLGLPVIGHLSQTSWTAAAESGIDGLLHGGSGGPISELVTSEGRRFLAQAQGISVEEFEDEYRSLGSLIRIVGGPEHLAGQRIRDLIDIDGPRVDRLIQALLDNNTMVDPTLVTDESLAFADDIERILSHLEPYRAPRAVRDFLWGNDWETRNRYANPDRPTALYLKPLFEFGKELTLRFFDEGVLLGAGSDVGMPWMTPGASFHRELELLVEAGIPVEAVLEIGTRNGSHFVYRSDEIGTIEEGKLADLVVLGADPLEDIRNTRSIEIVMKDGVMYDPAVILEDIGGII